jgi:hypothetical protein
MIFMHPAILAGVGIWKAFDNFVKQERAKSLEAKGTENRE